MIKRYLILSLFIGLLFGVGFVSTPQPLNAHHPTAGVLFHNNCFDLFGLEPNEANITTDVLLCQQVMLLWDIRDKLYNEEFSSNFNIVLSSSTMTI